MSDDILKNRNAIYKDIDDIISNNYNWTYLFNKRIFITGGTSYLMNYFIRVLIRLNELRNANIDIIVMARSQEKMYKMYSDIDLDKVSIIYSDICDKSWIKNDRADYIINAASPANPNDWARSPLKTINTLTEGTQNVLKACKEWKTKRLLQISSSVVYGTDASIGEKLTEDKVGKVDFNEIANTYAIGKITGEMLCQCYRREFGINYSVARPFIIYGPNMDVMMKKAFTDFLFNTLNYEDIVMKSDGLAERSYCYVADLVSGLFAILLNGADGEAYNIANSHEIVSIRKLAETFANQSMGKSKVIYLSEQNDKNYLNVKINSMLADTSKIEALGWKAQVDLGEGIRRTLSCYR